MATLTLSPPQKDRISYDLLFCLFITLVFTHVGEPFAFLEGYPYLGLLLLNMAAICTAWFMTRSLAQRGATIWWSICLLPLIILSNEILCYSLLPNYGAEPAEYLTVVFPFSYLLVICCHAYYRRQAGTTALSVTKDWSIEKTPAAPSVAPRLLVQTARGEVRINVADLMAIHLAAHKTMLYLSGDATVSVLDTLSQLTRQLPETTDFFPVNRRCHASRRAITGYLALPDGRLSVDFPGGSAIVSKNKAADFKRWWKAS